MHDEMANHVGGKVHSMKNRNKLHGFLYSKITEKFALLL